MMRGFPICGEHTCLVCQKTYNWKCTIGKTGSIPGHTLRVSSRAVIEYNKKKNTVVVEIYTKCPDCTSMNKIHRTKSLE